MQEELPNIACEAGISTDPDRSLWVRSPRTGHVAEVPERYVAHVGFYVRQRVAKARSEGRAVVAFTKGELRLVKEYADKAAHEKANPEARPTYRMGKPSRSMSARWWQELPPNAPD